LSLTRIRDRNRMKDSVVINHIAYLSVFLTLALSHLIFQLQLTTFYESLSSCETASANATPQIVTQEQIRYCCDPTSSHMKFVNADESRGLGYVMSKNLPQRLQTIRHQQHHHLQDNCEILVSLKGLML
jgi:hypothetical protein